MKQYSDDNKQPSRTIPLSSLTVPLVRRFFISPAHNFSFYLQLLSDPEKKMEEKLRTCRLQPLIAKKKRTLVPLVRVCSRYSYLALLT